MLGLDGYERAQHFSTPTSRLSFNYIVIKYVKLKTNKQKKHIHQINWTQKLIGVDNLL